MPFYVWEKPVPRIADIYTDGAVYIYRSVEDAKTGERQGGSGFLVSVPSLSREGWAYPYAVTNSHVVRKAKTPVVRLNRRDGATELFPTEADHWVHHSDGDDV